MPAYMTVLRRFEGNIYQGDSWKSDIVEIVDSGDFDGLDSIEQALKSFNYSEQYTDVLTYISEQRANKS